MGRTVSGEEPCRNHRQHRRERNRLEIELAISQEQGLPLSDAWQRTKQVYEREWSRGHDALLQSFWHDMSCGCTFGALHVQTFCNHVEVAS